MSFIYLTISISVLLILSALFSGAETAFFSLTKIHVKQLELDNNSCSRRILRLLHIPKQLLITTLLGNTLVNITATALSTLYVIRASYELGLNSALLILLNIIFMTILLLFFAEILPKLYAFSSPIKAAKLTLALIMTTRFIFYPLIISLEWLTSKISRKEILPTETVTTITSEDIRNIVKSEKESFPLEENEKSIIDSVFRFSETNVKEIMVPRVDITGIELSTPVTEAKKLLGDTGYSRIPIYKKNVDDIIGVIHAKDFILYPDKKTLPSMVRKVIFVPENMKIQTLLNMFQSKKKQIAIVVDEYGGTSGLVTLEDIVEQLVGDIKDEYDDEKPLISELSPTSYLISAMVQVSELNRKFELNLSDEFDNLAELLYSELNHIPHLNEKYIIENSVEFIISHLTKQRIDYVVMNILSQSPEEL